MINQLPDHQVATVECADADEVFLCCDCLGWFSMNRVDDAQWRLVLQLQPGEHHIRYYVRCGRATRWLGAEQVVILAAPVSEAAETGTTSASYTPAP